MCVSILWWVSISKAFYKVVAKRGQAAQLCVFILGIPYLYLGVLKHVFGYGCVVYVLVSCMFIGVLQHFVSIVVIHVCATKL